MKKEQYDEPRINLLCFDSEDVIRTSNLAEPMPIGDWVE